MKHKRVLAWVNRIRREHFGKGPIKRLPSGAIYNVRGCVFHKCFFARPEDGCVSMQSVHCRHGVSIAMPGYVVKFHSQLLNGKYPELVK